MQNVTMVVKRHPEGHPYVPLDFDPAPERTQIVAAYMKHLIDGGHVVERIDGFQHRPDGHPQDFHLKIVSGPLADLGRS